ncbi:PAS domain S-box protein [Bradyrhizobium oligotrophicum]|uniref:PAS domain S-box protein n=1 Tax=Bradyrhizobium oligotrophicum TaxID=44255 RepID=UPI003EC09835
MPRHVIATLDPWLPQEVVQKLYLRPRHLQPGSFNAYVLAVLLVAVAIALRMTGADLLPSTQFITLLPAILLATLICGMAAGFFAVVVAVLAAWFFIIPPAFSFKLDEGQGVALLLFAAIGSLDVIFVGAMRAAIVHSQNLNETLSTVFESNPDSLLLVDLEGRIVNANRQAATMFGRTSDELIGMQLESLLPERLWDQHVAHRHDFMKDPKPRQMGLGLDLWGRRASGAEFPVDVQIGAIKLKTETLAIATVRDLTRQIRLTQELATSKQQQAILKERERVADELRLWADAFQCAAIGIEISDPRSGTVRFVNPAYARARGIGVDDAKGMAVADVYVEEERARLPELFATADLRGQVSVESRHLRKDGTSFAVEIDIASKRDETGAVIYRLTSSRDVSAAKLIEEQLRQAQKMEVIGQLSGGIAHDFNNLLTVIVANAEILCEDPELRDDLRRIAADISQAGQRGAALTQRLLAFSRKQLLRPIAIDCRALLDSMQKMLSRTLRENIRIVVVDNPKPAPAFADHSQLEAAVLNLAVNAQDAMPDGGCLVLAADVTSLDDHYRSLQPDVAPGEYVMISVTDNGTGMTPEVLAHAFEPFFTTKDVGKGSGLGLSMVFGFAKQSNGHVSLYSEPGLGTTVRIYLPLVASETAGVAAEQEIASVPHGHETILIVEDDPFVRMSVIRAVESLGYKVVAAENGNDALVEIKVNDDIDVLFTDIVMPGGISGWQLVELARQVRPGLAVIFTSGYPRDSLAESGHAAADAIVLTKPYRKAELALRLRDALTKRLVDS